MMSGTLEAICLCRQAGGGMQYVESAQALESMGLEGDRYATAEGSFNKGIPGKRQVTLMNSIFFAGSGFEYSDSRRNLFTEGVELMWLIGREFQIGEARFKGVKYCDPCRRPSKLSGKWTSFQDVFFDRGGLVAEVITGGRIRVGDSVIPPPKKY